MIATLRVLRWSSVSAFADLRAIYTWKTWTFAWLLRVLCQVAFFALIGRLLGSQEAVDFLLVGNAMFVGVATVLFIVPSSAWERATGTLPLLIASPSRPFVVFAGRSVQWLADGLAVSVISLLGLSALFGSRFDYPTTLLAVPIILLVLVSVYWFGLAIAGFVLGRPQLRNVVGNLAGLVLMIVCGVQVPIAFWPDWIQWLSHGLPMSHGLLAIRQAVSGNSDVLGLVLLEVAVGAGWFVIAALTFDRLAARGRRDGSIEFGD